MKNDEKVTFLQKIVKNLENQKCEKCEKCEKSEFLSIFHQKCGFFRIFKISKIRKKWGFLPKMGQKPG